MPCRAGTAIATRSGERADIAVDARRNDPLDRSATGYFRGPRRAAGEAECPTISNR
jgi:hypothetical protein